MLVGTVKTLLPVITVGAVGMGWDSKYCCDSGDSSDG